MIGSWYSDMFGIYTGGGQIGKMNRKHMAKFKNDLVFQNTFMRLCGDFMDAVEIDGLPDTADERTVKQSLIWYRGVEFFEKGGSILTLPGAPDGGGMNIYRNFNSFWVYSGNGLLSEKVSTYIHGSDEDAFLKKGIGGILGEKPKGVFVWDNEMRWPLLYVIVYLAQCIADTMRTLDVCRVNIKNPYIITAEESIVNSVKEYFNKRDNNEEFIITSGIFPADKIQLLPLATNSDNLQACTALIEWYEAKARELCGIDNNSQIDKKGENLISDEVSINDMYTQMQVDRRVECIQKGLDDVNKLFGTNITVRARYKGKKEELEDEAKDLLSDENGNGSVPGNGTADGRGDSND